MVLKFFISGKSFFFLSFSLLKMYIKCVSVTEGGQWKETKALSLMMNILPHDRYSAMLFSRRQSLQGWLQAMATTSLVVVSIIN